MNVKVFFLFNSIVFFLCTEVKVGLRPQLQPQAAQAPQVYQQPQAFQPLQAAQAFQQAPQAPQAFQQLQPQAAQATQTFQQLQTPQAPQAFQAVQMAQQPTNDQPPSYASLEEAAAEAALEAETLQSIEELRRERDGVASRRAALLRQIEQFRAQGHLPMAQLMIRNATVQSSELGATIEELDRYISQLHGSLLAAMPSPPPFVSSLTLVIDDSFAGVATLSSSIGLFTSGGRAWFATRGGTNVVTVAGPEAVCDADSIWVELLSGMSVFLPWDIASIDTIVHRGSTGTLDIQIPLPMLRVVDVHNGTLTQSVALKVDTVVVECGGRCNVALNIVAQHAWVTLHPGEGSVGGLCVEHSMPPSRSSLFVNTSTQQDGACVKATIGANGVPCTVSGDFRAFVTVI